RYLCCKPFFFLQAEDGVRDFPVTGVQTCALPISSAARRVYASPSASSAIVRPPEAEPVSAASTLVASARDTSGPPSIASTHARKIGRASCRVRVWSTPVHGSHQVWLVSERGSRCG